MTDDWVDEVVQQMLVDYTAWVNGEPVPWNVRKAEAKDYIRAKQAEAVEAARKELLTELSSCVVEIPGEDDERFYEAVLSSEIYDRLDQLTNNTEKE